MCTIWQIPGTAASTPTAEHSTPTVKINQKTMAAMRGGDNNRNGKKTRCAEAHCPD
jgi:hypothetical protein